jgi:hypothetical protein
MSISDKLFKTKPLSAEEKTRYIGMGEQWVAPLLETVNQGEADGWAPIAVRKGVSLHKKVEEGNPVVLIRGQCEIKNYSIKQALQSQKDCNTTTKLRSGFKVSSARISSCFVGWLFGWLVRGIFTCICMYFFQLF